MAVTASACNGWGVKEEAAADAASAGGVDAGWDGGAAEPSCAGAPVTEPLPEGGDPIDTLSSDVVYTIRESPWDFPLERIDLSTMEIETVGAVGTLVLYGDCAWHPTHQRLYVVDGLRQDDIPGSNELYRVNPATGDAALVGAHGLERVFGLAYHPPTGTLLAAGGEPASLYEIDPGTASARLIGATGLSEVDGLAWDSRRCLLIAQVANLSGAAMYTIDVGTGVAAELVDTPGINNHGMTYDPAADRLVAADTDGNLFAYDPSDAYQRTSLLTDIGWHTCVAYRPANP